MSDVLQLEPNEIVPLSDDIPDPRQYIRDLEVYRSNHEDGKNLYFAHVDELREWIKAATSIEELYAISDEARRLDEWAVLWIDHWRVDKTTCERLQKDLDKREGEIRAVRAEVTHMISVGIIKPAREEVNVR